MDQDRSSDKQERGLAHESYNPKQSTPPELWDAYDEAFAKIPNKTLIRGEKILQGMFRLVCDILVKHADGTFLLMRRDPRKHYGGLWEATAGGSALVGEAPLQCAVRELKEETGKQTAAK